MVKIELICPICSKKHIVQIEEEDVQNNVRGVSAVNIINDNVCPHSFIAYLDRAYNLRDYLIVDFTVEIPDFSKDSIEELDLKKIEDLDTDIVKLNLYPIILVYLLKACFYKEKILILNELDFLKPLFENFFNLIINGSFDYNILIKSKKDYEANKRKFKDYIIFEGKNIIRDKQKIFDYKKNKIEKKIVQNFFADYDTNTSVIIIRNEIKNAYILSKTIVEVVQTLKQKEKININYIIDKLQHMYEVIVSREYLSFLIEIVENYFKVKVPIIYENVLGFV